MKKKQVKVGLLTIVLIVIMVVAIAAVNMHTVVTKVTEEIAEQEATTDAQGAQVLEGETFTSTTAGVRQPGTLANRTGNKITLASSPGTNAVIDIPDGYYENLKIDATAVYNQGKTDTIENLQEKSVTPSTSSQTITADSGKSGLSKVTVGAVSATKTLAASDAGKTSVDMGGAYRYVNTSAIKSLTPKTSCTASYKCGYNTTKDSESTTSGVYRGTFTVTSASGYEGFTIKVSRVR